MEIVDVKQLLISTLKSVFNDYPICLQGSMSDNDDYPANFFTYWNNETFDTTFYDNTENQTIWDFDLNFYSSNPVNVNNVLKTAKTALKTAGFIVNGTGHDVISDEPTHTGRGISLIYIQKL